METDECVVWPHRKGPSGHPMWSYRNEAGKSITRYVTHEALERRGFPRPEGGLALHAPLICHNASCVNYKHLRWGTYAENAADRDVDKMTRRGENHQSAMFTNREAVEIRAAFREGERITAIARRYGVNYYVVSNIIHNRTYRDVAPLAG